MAGPHYVFCLIINSEFVIEWQLKGPKSMQSAVGGHPLCPLSAELSCSKEGCTLCVL